MWKVFLAFVTHRLFLLMVALLTLNSTARPGSPSTWDRLLTRVGETPEARVVAELSHRPLSEAIASSRNVFHWGALVLCRTFNMHSVMAMIVLSNLVLLFFLMELFILFNRMTTTDISTVATSFVLLWPTSYELSLGSSLTLACLVVTVALRQALEQRWWAAGIAGGALALMDPISIALLPAFGYLFWSVQRFQIAKIWGRNLAFFLGPLLLGAVLSGESWSTVLTTLDGSALFNLFQMAGSSGQAPFSHSLAGQTVSLIFFFLGAAGAVFSNLNPLHRFLPLMVLLGLVLSTPYHALASRVPLAGVCMEGVASASSGPASRIASMLMILLGAYEVYSVFVDVY